MDAHGVVDVLEPGNVDLDGLRNVTRKAFHPEAVKAHEEVAIASLHGRRLADDDDRYVDLQLLLEVDAEQVDVDRAFIARVLLDFLDQDLLGPATVDHKIDEVGAAGLGEYAPELMRIESDGLGVRFVAVNDARHAALFP